MTTFSRREFLAAAATASASLLTSSRKAPALEGAAGKPKVALIHATDLLRPHADPDDHFDLATVYSLAVRRRFELLAVMIDHPPADFGKDPDVLAVAQMNRLSGLAVPVLTGSPRRLDPAEALLPENREVVGGVVALLRIMRASALPVAISVVGSCRDVALAGRLDPELFAAKCAGIYLNAGSGTPDRAKAGRLEYNVELDPASYGAIFGLPCPVFWLPCFEVAPGGGVPMAVGEFGTYYRFLQKDILPRLSPRLQNYFAFMFKQGESERDYHSDASALRPDWLSYLDGPPDRALLERQGDRFRNMWCTAGFLHVAGLAVTGDGEIRERAETASVPVYTFDSVRVRCGADGVTEWSPDPGPKNRFLFHVRDTGRYPAAMTTALGELLGSWP